MRINRWILVIISILKWVKYKIKAAAHKNGPYGISWFFLDFKVICVHCESLHAHDAIAIITKNIENGLQATFSQSEIHDIVLNSIM